MWQTEGACKRVWRRFDLSPAAVEVARRNAEACNISATRCNAYCGDMFEALPSDTEPFDLILFNPPQVSNIILQQMPLQRTLCEPAAFHAERQSTLHSRLRAKTLSLLFANHHNASLMQAALSDVTTLTPCSHTSVRGSSRVRRKKARQIWWRRRYCYAFVTFASL